MPSPGQSVSPDSISKDEFNSLLDAYPGLVQAISQGKGTKNGQKTLQQLDAYRYHEALQRFGIQREEMTLEHVQTLVEWKLRHGKFRPTLMKLVTSNDPSFVKSNVKSAIDAYRTNKNPHAALDTLTKLKGIGPATASLLLTVHDPENVIFFSDEAFHWLCCGGKVDVIRYNAKEYQMLQRAAKGLMTRLDVSATDLEKVAYVLMNEGDEGKADSKKAKPAKKEADTKTARPPVQHRKRTAEGNDKAALAGEPRRSKRLKA